MCGVVTLREIWVEHELRDLADSSGASELTNNSGVSLGIRVYGHVIASQFSQLTDACHVDPGDDFLCTGFWRPKSNQDLKEEVDRLGYLIVGSGTDSYRRILLLSDFDKAKRIWQQSLEDYAKAELAKTESLVITADAEFDVPF